MTNCLAYYRTSSATNVGEDKDSLKRQNKQSKNMQKRINWILLENFTIKQLVVAITFMKEKVLLNYLLTWNQMAQKQY